MGLFWILWAANEEQPAQESCDLSGWSILEQNVRRPPEFEELEGQMLEELLQSQSDLIFVVLHS